MAMCAMTTNAAELAAVARGVARKVLITYWLKEMAFYIAVTHILADRCWIDDRIESSDHRIGCKKDRDPISKGGLDRSGLWIRFQVCGLYGNAGNSLP